MKKGPYSNEEIFLLQSHYCTCEEFAAMLHRTKVSIYQYCSRNRIIIKHENEWSEQELQLLSDKYPCTRNDELVKLFPGRTIPGMVAKARKLGLLKSREYLHQVHKDDNKYPKTGENNRKIPCIRLDTLQAFPMIKELAKSLGTSACNTSFHLKHKADENGDVFVNGIPICYLRDLPCGLCQHCYGITDDKRSLPRQMCGCSLDCSITDTSTPSCKHFKLYQYAKDIITVDAR